MSLKNAAGTDLGTFEVKQVDAQGRALLAAAGTVSGIGGAASYRGEYRFDEVATRHGAGLLAHDPVTGSEVVFQGDVPVTGEIHATNVTVKSGAVVRPQGTSLLRFVVAGKLTVEAGGRIDATATGYAGGYAAGSRVPGLAPAGIAASQPDAGGSHGGTGGRGNDAGLPGAVYGSIYEPLLGGGGGSQEAWGPDGAAATAAAWSTSR